MKKKTERNKNSQKTEKKNPVLILQKLSWRREINVLSIWKSDLGFFFFHLALWGIILNAQCDFYLWM